MSCVRFLFAVALLALLPLRLPAFADGGIPDGRIRLPATVREVHRFISDAPGYRTIAEVREMSGTQPERFGASVYQWRLADGKMVTVTMMTEKGEVISCWGPAR